jgi:hypothetical protein
MAGFYAVGAHLWAVSALFFAEPPGSPPLPYALSPEEVTRMLLDHGVAIRRIHEELALLRELLTERLPPPRASLPASSTAALPTPSTGPFVVETVEKMLTRQVTAAVRFQAAARSLLARRRVGWLLDLHLIQPCTHRSSFMLFVTAQRRRLRQRNIRRRCGCRWRRVAS